MIYIYDIYDIYLLSAETFDLSPPCRAPPAAPPPRRRCKNSRRCRRSRRRPKPSSAAVPRPRPWRSRTASTKWCQKWWRNGGFIWISMDFYEFSVASCGFGHSLSLEMVGFGWFWWIFWLDYLTKNVKLWDGGCLILFNDFSTKRGFWQWCDL